MESRAPASAWARGLRSSRAWAGERDLDGLLHLHVHGTLAQGAVAFDQLDARLAGPHANAGAAVRLRLDAHAVHLDVLRRGDPADEDGAGALAQGRELVAGGRRRRE